MYLDGYTAIWRRTTAAAAAAFRAVEGEISQGRYVNGRLSGGLLACVSLQKKDSDQLSRSPSN